MEAKMTKAQAKVLVQKFRKAYPDTMELLRPRDIRKMLIDLKGDQSWGEFASAIGCDKANLCEALKARRSLPTVATRKVGWTRVVAYAPINEAYPPLDNGKKRATKHSRR